MRRHLLSAAALILACGAVARAQVPVDTGWTYQGKLTNAGNPATGNYDLRFTLYSNAAGTTQVGSPLTLAATPVSAGLFSVKLDFGAQFLGSKRWLKVEVSPAGAGTYTALPVQEITSSPQAILAQALTIPYQASSNIAGLGSLIKLTNTNTSDGTAIWGETNGTTGIAVVGSATALTGNAYGGQFFSSSVDGRGVLGQATATTGLALGGRFLSASTGGRGIWSTADATTGANYGVYGQSSSTSGTAMYGIALSTTGFNFGGQFETNSVDGRGVRGIANATTGLAVGGRFASASTGGIGVWTTASATSGGCIGLYADTNSAAGYGGYFKNSAGGAAVWVDGLCRVKTLQILGGADLAEPFDVAPATAGAVAEPGMVVIIDAAHPGDLRLADSPYDSKVAGVISGANGLQPGMVMSSKDQEHADGKHPVAMTGRVWVYVDASFGTVQPGDLLTTSSTPGHAMIASDHGRAFGAVIGKAMTELKEGKGLVLVLVNLQ